MIRTIAAAITVTALAACSSVPMGTPEQDAALKLFKPVDGKAVIYVYRDETMWMTNRMDIQVNGVEIGSTTGLTYIQAELPPGRHQITSKAEDNHTITIEAKPGQILYVWQEVKMGGWMARSKLQVVDEATGQAGVRKTKLAVR